MLTTSRGQHTTRDARGVMGLCLSLVTAARGDVPSSVRVFRASRSEFNARVSCLPGVSLVARQSS